jgi:hypothetical protein
MSSSYTVSYYTSFTAKPEEPAYHTEVFARYAIKYCEKYGNATQKSKEYLLTANKWLEIELSRQTGITRNSRNLKEFENLRSRIQPLLISSR